MIARFVALLAMFAITVVTTVTSAHAARMGLNFNPDHGLHVSEMTHSADLACDGYRHCGSADAEMCEFVCMGLSVFLTSPRGAADCDHGSASHEFPSKEMHVSRAPGPNEHPPKLSLF